MEKEKRKRKNKLIGLYVSYRENGEGESYCVIWKEDGKRNKRRFDNSA